MSVEIGVTRTNKKRLTEIHVVSHAIIATAHTLAPSLCVWFLVT